jgi:PTH2 family peptidyl-tRNA hydrolase
MIKMKEEYKQIIVVRKDLKLSKGKLAVQVAHACLDAYKKSDTSIRKEWESQGGKKVVVFAENMKDMLRIKGEADRYKLPSSMIRDAGRTELPPGTTTALGIGPSESKILDRVTGDLKMV